jgi:hypothetical protein
MGFGCYLIERHTEVLCNNAYDEKEKKGCAMAPQFPHKAQQEENRWLSPLLQSILAAMSFMVVVDIASPAVAAECKLTEKKGEVIQGITAWKSATSSTLSLTNTITQNISGGFAPSPVREGAPNNSRFAWGNIVGQEIATIGACLRQDIRKSACLNQAVINSFGKPQAKGHKSAMKVSIHHNGKRQVSRMRTTQLEIGIPAHDEASTIIGPVQATQHPILSNERGVRQSVAASPSIGQSQSFGGQPFVALNPFQNALQLPDNESIRMNLTTTQALHEGNCANGCP